MCWRTSYETRYNYEAKLNSILQKTHDRIFNCKKKKIFSPAPKQSSTATMMQGFIKCERIPEERRY